MPPPEISCGVISQKHKCDAVFVHNKYLFCVS